MDPGAERRQHPRFPVSAKVTIADREPPEYYLTEDLSLGGLFIVSDRRLPVGTHLAMEIAIQGLDVFRAHGVVVRQTMQHPTGHGIQFTQLDDGALERLSEYLNRIDR